MLKQYFCAELPKYFLIEYHVQEREKLQSDSLWPTFRVFLEVLILLEKWINIIFWM